MEIARPAVARRVGDEVADRRRQGRLVREHLRHAGRDVDLDRSLCVRQKLARLPHRLIDHVADRDGRP